MKSRTSFFNRTVLKKDIFRFAPVWALYTVFLFLIFSLLDLSLPKRTSQDLVDMMQAMVWINLFYGGICANLLFGDLFIPRMCNALHTMPMRREGWFMTHLSAGALFSFVPNLLGACALCVILGEYFYLALLWLAVMTLQFVFFFGIGTLSVMCTGNRLGMTAVYVIINFISLLVYVLADQLYEPLLYGIRIDSTMFEFFCPALGAATEYVKFYHDTMFEGLYWEAWYYLLAMAALGVIALVGAVLLYRRRRLECAGDFLALRSLEPVFLIIYTLGVGVAMYAFTLLFGISSSYTFMAIGSVAGFFTGQMLLERSVKVFRPKTFLGFAAFALLLTGTLVITRIDPLNITRFVPETEQIEFMRVYRDNDSYIYSDPVDPDLPVYQLEAPEQIDRFRNIHNTLQAERGNKAGELCQVEILYQLKDGSTIMRYYQADTNSAAFEDLRSYFSSPEYIFCTEDVDSFIRTVSRMELDLRYEFYDLDSNRTNYIELEDPQVIHGLMQALLEDCKAGTMAQDYVFHPYEDSHLWVFFDGTVMKEFDNLVVVDAGEISRYRDLMIFSGSKNTLAFIDNYLQTYKSAN